MVGVVPVVLVVVVAPVMFMTESSQVPNYGIGVNGVYPISPGVTPQKRWYPFRRDLLPNG